MSLARKAYNQIQTTGTVNRAGFCYAHYKGLLNVIETGKPNGRKCKALFRNLVGIEDSVPVDIWLMRYAGFTQQQPSKWQYDLIEDTIKEEARELGITPAQHQAEIWCEIRGDSRGYADYLKQLRLL